MRSWLFRNHVRLEHLYGRTPVRTAVRGPEAARDDAHAPRLSVVTLIPFPRRRLRPTG